MAGGVEYQVTKVDPTSPETKGMVHQVHKVSEEIAATIGGKVYRARIINDPTAPTVAGKVYQIVLIDDPDDSSVKGMVYNAILTGGSEAVVVGPAVSPLSLPDAVADSLAYVKAFGGTEQNGTPTPTVPVDIISNNGALKVGQAVTVTPTRNYAYINATGSWSWSNDSYSVALPVEVGKKYKIDIANTDASVVGVIFRYGFTDEDPEDFKQSEVTPSPVSVSIYDYWRGTPQELSSVVVTATHPYLVIQFSAAFTASVVANYLTVTDMSVVRVEGTQETAWVHGKNLFDSTPYKTGYYIDASGNEVEATQYQEEYLIRQARVQPSTQYTISLKGVVSGYTQRIHAYDAAGNWLSQVATISAVSPGAVSSASFTTPANCAYIRQGGRSQTEYQLEQGSTATAYEPYYDGGIATTEMLLKVGDYQDVQSIIDGVVTRNVGVRVLDGTESWAVATTNVLQADVLPSNAYGQTCICSHLQYTTSATFGNMPDNSFKNGSTTYPNRLYVKSSTLATDATTWKTWLAQQYAAGAPVIVLYPLATPTTESVTGQILQVQDGDNTLEITQASLNNLELEAGYEAAVTLTVQEAEDANLDNNVTVTIE